MGRKSSITRLDPEVKSYIEAMLATGAQTLVELIADLQEKFPAEAKAGALPSKSAMQRYGQKLNRRLSAIKASTEAARLISEQAGDEKDARSEAVTALIQTALFDAILEFEEASDQDMDPIERMSALSTVAKNVGTLTRSSVNIKKFQAEVETATRKKVLEEQRAKLEAMGSKGGVTEETKLAIREALGIT